MAKHTTTDGDAALREAKERRAKELASLREQDPMFADVVPEGWVSRETGFPPYLVVKPGTMFRGQILLRDTRDEYVTDDGEVRPFVRYHIKLTAPSKLGCRRGPNDERGEELVVNAGQIFTIGEYTQLAGEMQALLGLEMAVVCRKETPFKDRRTGEPRKRFDFDCLVSPQTEKQLVSETEEDQQLLRSAYREARRLAMKNSFLVQSTRATAPVEVAAE